MIPKLYKKRAGDELNIYSEQASVWALMLHVENSDSCFHYQAKKSSILLQNFLTKGLVTGAFLHQLSFFFFFLQLYFLAKQYS